MNSMQAPARELRHVTSNVSKSKPIGLIALILVGIATLLAVYALQSRGLGDRAVISVLALLAVAGVFSLFGWAVGLVRLTGRSGDEVLVGRYAETLEEALEIVDAQGNVVYANPAMLRLLADTQSDAGASLEHLFMGETQAAEAFYRLARTVKAGHTAEEILPLIGRGLWLKVSVQPIDRDEHGVIAAWRVNDITREHVRNAKALSQLEDSVRYLDKLPVGFITSTADGRIEHVNATLAGWLGLDEARIGAGEVRLTDILDRDNAALLTVPQSDGELVSLDLDLRRQDGGRFAARLIHQRASGDDLGKVKARTLVMQRGSAPDPANGGVPSDLRDVARFFQSAPMGIAVLDTEGTIVTSNGAFARIFAEPRKAPVTSLDKVIRRASAPETRNAIRTAFDAALSGNADGGVFEAAFGANGDATRRLSFGPLTGEDGATKGVMLYVIDATEQKALELKFAQSQKMEAVGQLAGGIAHDFNNVLQVIIGTSELYQRDRRPTDPGFSEMMQILTEANRAANLVGQLLAFSRKQTLTPKVLALNDVVQDLGYSLKRLLGEKIELKIAGGRELWYVRADRTQFQQVIINLAVNARDAMPDGGQLTIRTRNVSERESTRLVSQGMVKGEYVVVEVEDTGIGMSEETVAKIFEPFFTTKEVGKGTGLGLSTVYGIVKQTGGFVFAESALGKGTTFRVYLPRHHGQTEEEQADQADQAGGAKKPATRDLTGSGRVLLVEDEDGVRAFAVRALQRQGYEVLEAGTGVEALEVVRANEGTIDVVISDVMMPEMDGPTLLREVRKTNPDLKFIFVSGYPDDAFRQSLADGEQFEFLPKPFRLPQLAAKVKETIGR